MIKVVKALKALQVIKVVVVVLDLEGVHKELKEIKDLKVQKDLLVRKALRVLLVVQMKNRTELLLIMQGMYIILLVAKVVNYTSLLEEKNIFVHQLILQDNIVT